MSSWAEDVCAYSAKKKQAPEALPVRRCLRKAPETRAAEVRPFNIVTCEVKDPEVAKQWKQRDEQAVVTHVQSAIQKELAQASHAYDFVTMRPKYGVDDAVVSAASDRRSHGKRILPPKVFTRYDIFTHDPHQRASRSRVRSRRRRGAEDGRHP